MGHRGRAALLAAVLAAAMPGPAGAEALEYIELPTRNGVVQPIYAVRPAGPPVASVVLFTGGDGRLNGGRNPPSLSNNNFLVRSRDRFAAHGLLVAIPDVPSDHASGLGTFRESADHATDIAAVIAYLRRRAPVPVWLVGTSRGTISAADAAIRIKTGGPDGLVLTSTIALSSRTEAGITTLDLDEIAVPTLFIHNREDGCQACPFHAVPAIVERLSHAPRRELIAVSGGDTPRSSACEALSRHGFLGIEDEVVGDIARWIAGR